MEDNKIITKFLRKDRWYVKLTFSINGRFILPYANYIWLIGNPAFEDIPKGYAIHHLDGDRFNDDISNLALMEKHHHIAHHWKQKTTMTEIKIKPEFIISKRTIFFPTKEPRIYQKPGGKYYIQFAEKLDGERKLKNIHSWEGVSFETKEMAEKIKNLIWNDKPKIFEEPSGQRLGSQF